MNNTRKLSPKDYLISNMKITRTIRVKRSLRRKILQYCFRYVLLFVKDDVFVFVRLPHI